MSEQPLVCCVMLTRDRPEMAKRAVECFRRQTYENKRLLIWDTSEHPMRIDPFQEVRITGERANGQSIGTLRNHASAEAHADILCHFDSDDWSHSDRLAEQAALLQASGADCVGYSDMLFWDTRPRGIPGQCFDINGEYWHSDGECADCSSQAWLYLGPQKALGTSLCYWRRTWERKPFPDQPRPGHANGEDTDWIKGLELRAVPSTGSLDSLYVHFVEVPNLDGVRQYEPGKMTVSGDPRMIASIHGANTSGSYKLIADSTSWRRVPEWDEYCRKAMAL